jgi:hypothetical protein
MKKAPSFFGKIFFLFTAIFSIASPGIVSVSDLHPGIEIKKDNMLGAVLAIWNPPTRFYDMKQALVDGGYKFFRFPNGSLSNEYHWNGNGYYDSTGVYHVKDTSYLPGFIGETIYRGTNKDNYGFVRKSHMTDDNLETMWWGEIIDPLDPPWAVIEFQEKVVLDSLEIAWGNLKPKAFDLNYWIEDYIEYPGVHQNFTDTKKKFATVKVKSTTTKLGLKKLESRYIVIRFKTKDLPKEGVQIRELKLFSGGRNLLDGNNFKAFGLSTRLGDKERSDWTGIKWHFEEYMIYIKQMPDAKALICVNAGTGNAKEAADWVYYANKVKGYNIKNWQIGNELDGEWEEAGPLSARQYVVRYLERAKAMKAVDSTIVLHGPVFSSYNVLQRGAGLSDGKYWLEEALRLIGEAEKKDGKRYLDVVDFHMYPYWAENNLNSSDMLKAMLAVKQNIDSIDIWMKRHLEGERKILLSEFSSCVQGHHILMDYSQAAAVSMVFAENAMKFGNRLQVLPWDSFSNLFIGPDSTYGTISLTALSKEGSWSYWKSLEPTAMYYGVYMTYKEFLENGYFVLPVQSNTPEIVSYAVGKGDSIRVLLVNLSDKDKGVLIERESLQSDSTIKNDSLSKKNEPGKGDLVRTQVEIFGASQFKWIGTSQTAYAYPKMGPSGRRINPSKNKEIQVPAYGMAVVQINPKVLKGENANMPKILSASLEKRTVLAGDTLDLFVTALQENGQLVQGQLKIPELGIVKNIKPDDSLWNASIESFHVKIPLSENVQLGNMKILLTFEGLGQKKLNFEIPFRIRGKYRTTSVMEDFENGFENVKWFAVANGDNATNIGAKIFSGSKPHGSFMRHDFFVEQPPQLGWPNFVGAYYEMPPEVSESVGIVFDYATTHSNSDGYFELQIPSNQVKDYDEFMVKLKNTKGVWKRDTLIWENMKQEGWGNTIEKLDPKQIKYFAFRARHAGKGYISLDNLYLLKEDGTEIPMPKGLRQLR